MKFWFQGSNEEKQYFVDKAVTMGEGSAYYLCLYIEARYRFWHITHYILNAEGVLMSVWEGLKFIT